MCLGAWGSVYACVMALNMEGGFSWEEDPSKIEIHCPDPIGITLLVEYFSLDFQDPLAKLIQAYRQIQCHLPLFSNTSWT
jgi:hypothetical protein